MTAQDLFNRNFSPSRGSRSSEYKAGVLAALKYRLRETSCINSPYMIGTVQFDAWYFGLTEGHAIGRDYMNRKTHQDNFFKSEKQTASMISPKI